MPGLLPARRFPPMAASTWRNAVNQGYLLKAVVFVAAFSFAASSSGLAQAETWTMSVPELSLIEVGDDGAPVVVDRSGTKHRLRLVDGKIVLQQMPSVIKTKAPQGALTDSVVAVGKDGLKAWLDQPTERYGHDVLGDAIEAAALTVEYSGGVRQTLRLDDDAVFEDRIPWFVDMDGDGDQEIILVKAYLDAGAALVLIELGDRQNLLMIVAEAPAIGTPNRWLNPAGVGDIDGDGQPEALVVITPHIGGTLTAYEWQGDTLVVDHEFYGFSNHAIGSRELGLSLVVDLNGDGIAEVVVPDANRDNMTIVSFAGVSPKILKRFKQSGRITHRVVVHDLDGDTKPEITFAISDHEVVIWQPGL